MGSPDGGWYDETPPKVVSSSPADKGVNVKAKKITIDFNEYIKLEDAQNKVIVSPPQLEQAEIKAAGKSIVIELQDTLKENTTYTVDFSDAISDNNEGNPMGQYTFSFSTGDHIDTLEVSGYCLNAEDLEPIKGVLVGLYPYDVADSVFHHEPMMRVSRSNAAGQFTIKGVAPGEYRAFALQDADGDYVFGQKSEMIGFSHEKIEPTWKPDTRQDTIWRDTLHIENILRVGYTHFLPDDITMLCFKEPQTTRVLLKTERNEPNKIGVYFTYGNDTLPRLRGLNFDIDDKFVLDASAKKDTLIYWIADTTLINKDSLQIEMTYLMTDTLDQLVEKVDTFEAIPKVSYERRMKAKQKEEEKMQKELEKKKKRGELTDSTTAQGAEPSVPKLPPLEFRMNASGSLEPLQRLLLTMPEPLARCDSSVLHMYQLVDSVRSELPIKLVQRSTMLYEIIPAEIYNSSMGNSSNSLSASQRPLQIWTPGQSLTLEIDSAAFQGIYGSVSGAKKEDIKVTTEDQYATLNLNISGIPNLSSFGPALPSTQEEGSGATEGPSSQLIVLLVDGSDKIVRHQVAEWAKGASTAKAKFQYLRPNKYYVRAYIDFNGNGEWDTGCYDQDLQAEPVFYYNDEIECKLKWTANREWNITGTPRFKQKPQQITKQKPEAAKKQRSLNLERAKKLGKEYLQGQGINL